MSAAAERRRRAIEVRRVPGAELAGGIPSPAVPAATHQRAVVVPAHQERIERQPVVGRHHLLGVAGHVRIVVVAVVAITVIVQLCLTC